MRLASPRDLVTPRDADRLQEKPAPQPGTASVLALSGQCAGFPWLPTDTPSSLGLSFSDAEKARAASSLPGGVGRQGHVLAVPGAERDTSDQMILLGVVFLPLW